MDAPRRSDAFRGVGHTARSGVEEVVLIAVVAVWVAFWLNVVRLHLRFGHIIDAGATVLLTLVPAVLGYAWHLLGGVADVDLQGSVPGLAQET